MEHAITSKASEETAKVHFKVGQIVKIVFYGVTTSRILEV